MKVKLFPYKIIVGICVVLYSISSIITWLLYSVSEVDFKFFISEYGFLSVLLILLSLIVSWLFVLKPINIAIKAIEFQQKHEYGGKE